MGNIIHLECLYWFASTAESFDVLVAAHTLGEAKQLLRDYLAEDEDSPDFASMELFRAIPMPQHGDIVPF